MTGRTTRTSSLFPQLGDGLGLRPALYDDVLQGGSTADWFEVVSENYLSDGGPDLHILEKVRRDRPIALHGVSLSLGSPERADPNYLARLKRLMGRISPSLISDHCCFTHAQGESLHDLLPLPFTEEALKVLVENIGRVQDFLGRRILVENVSSYLTFRHSEMTEWEFLADVSRRADCGLLVDINNIYVNSVNHGFDPLRFLDGLPGERVGQFHLAGHDVDSESDGKPLLIDTHGTEVSEPVWALYREAVARFGRISTLIERDANIPPLQALESEMQRAKEIGDDEITRTARPGMPSRSWRTATADGACDHPA